MNRLGRFDDRGRPPSTSIRTLRRENSFSLIDTTMPASSGRNAPERHLNFAEGYLFHIAATGLRHFACSLQTRTRARSRDRAQPQIPGFERDRRRLAVSLEAAAMSSFQVSGGVPAV